MVPAWGGAYLLPRLIGPAAALKVIIENPLSQNKVLRGPDCRFDHIRKSGKGLSCCYNAWSTR